MSNGKLVRISDDTMEKLAGQRNGFETPNHCINRLLSKNPCGKGKKKKSDMDEEDEEEEDE